MEIKVKGTAAYATPEFVRHHFPDRYDEWFAMLSPQCREIMEGALAYNWYPVYEALVEPTEKVAQLFYDGDTKCAWEMGRFSAEYALTGIYKFFVKIGSPGFILSRASQIFSTYYDQGEMKIVERSGRNAVAQMTQSESHPIMELRVGGWIERALEIGGSREVTVEISQAVSQGDPVTEFRVAW
ncbi:MAG: hypothetical protein JW900_03120 [Anaerolineae bacterium]|nr:hypothetical protein [Anaerolineae bacterium]